METLEELIPFAREMLSQKPSRGLLKVYLVGSVLAVLGTVIGLVESVCHPFCSGGEVDAEARLRPERRTEEAAGRLGNREEGEAEEEPAQEDEAKTQTTTLSESPRLSQRTLANRLHAS